MIIDKLCIWKIHGQVNNLIIRIHSWHSSFVNASLILTDLPQYMYVEATTTITNRAVPLWIPVPCCWCLLNLFSIWHDYRKGRARFKKSSQKDERKPSLTAHTRHGTISNVYALDGYCLDLWVDRWINAVENWHRMKCRVCRQEMEM